MQPLRYLRGRAHTLPSATAGRHVLVVGVAVHPSCSTNERRYSRRRGHLNHVECPSRVSDIREKRDVCEYYGTEKSIAEVNESRSLPLTDRVRTWQWDVWRMAMSAAMVRD